MINFIPGIPHYAVADRCTTCSEKHKDIWFPKHALIYCPCCGRKLRKDSIHKERRKFENKDKEWITKVIKQRIEEGWTPIKLTEEMIKGYGNEYIDKSNWVT
ncbi:MAG: hypothetical protein ACTHME_06220 [Candidatus Nitrosocosmicus sp.]